jgi:outer membrane protein assembly factor BamB
VATPGGTRLWAARFSGGTGRSATASDVATSPDGSTVYVTGLTTEGGSTPMNTYDTAAYDAATGKQLWATRPGGGIAPAHAVVVSPDSSTVFVTGVDTRAYDTIALNASTGANLWESFYQPIHFAKPSVRSLAVSPDSSTLFVAGSLGTLAYNAATGAQVWSAPYKSIVTTGATSLAISPDGSAVYVTGVSAPATAQSQYLTIAYHAANRGGTVGAAYPQPGRQLPVAGIRRRCPRRVGAVRRRLQRRGQRSVRLSGRGL